MAEQVVLRYTLTPRARVSAGRGALVGNTRTVHDVIPGSVVRGALGTVWWSSDPAGFEPAAERLPLFDQVFRRALRVNAAVPFVRAPEPPGGQVRAALRAFSQVRCKYPGDGCTTAGWQDCALDERLGDRCACGSGWEEGRGWDLGPVEDALGQPVRVHTTRTALAEGVPRPEQLFTRTSTTTQVRFTGTLVLTGEDETLRPVTEWLATPREVSVGGQRSTLGRCRWSAHVEEPPTPPTGDVALRLRSPAILVDELGASTLDLPDAVRRLLGDGSPARVARAWVRPVVIGGWNGMAGLPKSEEHAVDAGSTVTLRDLDTAGRDALSRGIGLRQAEGYGEVELVGATPPNVPGAPGVCEVAAGSAQSTKTADDPLGVLVARLGPSRTRATLTGMRTQMRAVRRYRENGCGKELIDSRVVSAMPSLPWMRALSEAEQKTVQQVVSAEPGDLQRYLNAVDALLAEER